MPTHRKIASHIFYDQLFAQLPEIASMPEGEGVILRYTNGQELHANLHHRGETEELILAFYRPGKEMAEEQACYEVQLNHVMKTAQVATIRQEQEQSLFRRLAQINRHRVQNRELISRSGHSPTNTMLYQNLLSLFPVLETASPGQLRHPVRRDHRLPDLYILRNDPDEMTLEISPTGAEGIERMIISLDKISKTAGVTEISGTFGHYPAYLPYPDGKEMTPAERESYSSLLSDWLTGLDGNNHSIMR